MKELQNVMFLKHNAYNIYTNVEMSWGTHRNALCRAWCVWQVMGSGWRAGMLYCNTPPQAQGGNAGINWSLDNKVVNRLGG